MTGKKNLDTQSPFTVDIGPDGSYEYTGLTQKMHRKCMICMHFLCQSYVLMKPTYDTGHCLVWWPGASFGGQAPRWYPRFTLGDLFATTLIVKWPGASFGGQAPRWYPRFCWAVPKKGKGNKKGGQWQWTVVQVGRMIIRAWHRKCIQIMHFLYHALGIVVRELLN